LAKGTGERESLLGFGSSTFSSLPCFFIFPDHPSIHATLGKKNRKKKEEGEILRRKNQP